MRFVVCLSTLLAGAAPALAHAATPVLAHAAALAPDPAAVAKPEPAAQTAAFQIIARREAKLARLPYSLVDTVMKIESDYRPDRIGGVGEIGLMQVRPGTAAMLGFHGSAAELANPSTNIHYGAAYLGEAWRLAKGDVCRTLMKYRAGHGEESMTPLSVNYCQRARVHLASIDSPLAATITPASLVAVARESVIEAGMHPNENLRAGGHVKTGQAFWTAFQAHIRRLDAQVHAKWRRMASR